MKDINIYLMDLSSENNTSGVNRYLSILTHYLKGYKNIHIYRIKLLGGRSVLFYQENKKEDYTEIVLPLPQQTNEIIGERYWFQKYNEYAFSLIKHLFKNKSNRIVHIHTLNLIALASYIKSQITCKIITHLHCIPWKDLYNINPKKFNLLYAGYYYQEETTILKKEMFFSNNCEWESYAAADQIICVTNCAKDFLKKTMGIPEDRIEVIDNGINNIASDFSHKVSKKSSEIFQCLFVGVLSKSKGIFFILEALRKVQEQGYHICLNMAGTYSPSISKQITEKYSDLEVNLLGRISFEELQHYYTESDIGIIASLQEQCSYAAIEMAMFGLPLVTTAVDGLDEMFTDGINALKVNTHFSKVFGLSIDTDSLAEKIITLIENDDLRKRLSSNARQLYKERFNLESMIEKTLTVYRKLSGNCEEPEQTKKKSILFCIDSLNSGGAEKLLLNILEYMDYDRFDIDLLVIHEYGVYFQNIPEKVNWFTLKEADNYWFKNYDVEIAFQEGYSTKHIACRNSKALKIAWVHCDFSRFHWTTGFYKDNAEEQWCYSQLDRIVFVSGQTFKSFNQLFPDVQTIKQVIHTPINQKKILAASQSVSIHKNKITLCCIGRLIECKGYLRLIPILSKLKNNGFDFECWIIGEGKQKQKINELINQYSLEQTVFMKGFHFNPYPYLAASDLFVSASFTEGYSLAICEALCLGKPMLVTEVSGAKEIVGKCGMIVPQDEQAIYEGLKKLIENKDLRQYLSKKAFSRSKELFDYGKTMQTIFDLLKMKRSYE